MMIILGLWGDDCTHRPPLNSVAELTRSNDRNRFLAARGKTNRPAKTVRRMVATASSRTSRQLLFYSNETAKKSSGRTGGPYRSRAAIGCPVLNLIVLITAAVVVDGRGDGGGLLRCPQWKGGGGGPGVCWPLSRTHCFISPDGAPPHRPSRRGNVDGHHRGR